MSTPRWLRPWVLAAVALAGRAAAVEGPRIADIRPVEDRPYLAVDIAYPKAWPETAFTFEADGRAAPARALGGGFDPASNLATYLVFPGASCKRLVARWDAPRSGRTKAAPLAWKAPALALLLDHLGDREALFGPGTVDFQVFPPAAARFLQDGEELPATLVEQGGPGRRLRVSPRWRPGLNTVRMETTGPGGRAERDFTFVVLDDGGLAPGESARLVYGEVGGKSGPFYDLEVDGEAVRIKGDGFGKVMIARDGWVFESSILVAELAAEGPGEATIRIERKGHFLQEYEPQRELRVRVGSAPPAPQARGRGRAPPTVEDDPRYAAIFARIDDEVRAALADHPQRGAEGFCYVVWGTKKRLLKEKYGIDWRSPDEMNPHVIFD